ncbi:MAG TPA: hypothetical protein VHQ41_02535 [Patescibacteria group bacterium]|jgi:hypothetical protein|nr:hypothetical protein [Patescibacteria group bacterium]
MYRCSVCNSGYQLKSDALECERLKTEGEQMFGRGTDTKNVLGKKVIIFQPKIDSSGRQFHFVGYIADARYERVSSERLRTEFGYDRHQRQFNWRLNAHSLIVSLSSKPKGKVEYQCLLDQVQKTNERAGVRRNIDLPF